VWKKFTRKLDRFHGNLADGQGQQTVSHWACWNLRWNRSLGPSGRDETHYFLWGWCIIWPLPFENQFLSHLTGTQISENFNHINSKGSLLSKNSKWGLTSGTLRV